jgi:solute carrier family 25 carnitine/acylcarnitine transporter 20/29
MSASSGKDGKLVQAKDTIKHEIHEAKDAVAEGTKAATSDLVQSLRALVAGGVGGVCAVVTGHPFDLVKVNLQTAEKGTHKGAIDVVRKIVARQGASVCIHVVERLVWGVD